MTKKSKTAETIRAIAAVHNINRNDINSELHAPGVPIIAETDLSVTVIELVKAGRFTDAAKAIEIAVRRAYQCEGAP